MRRFSGGPIVLLVLLLSACASSPGGPRNPPTMPAQLSASFSRPPSLPAEGHVLRVGKGELYKKPSDAASSAEDGDTIEIKPGTYSDCAIWRASRLTILGVGGVVVRDSSCEDKAIFVTKGHDITVQGITFTGAHATAHNGAGIRAEGSNLTVEKSRFIDNEEGILAAASPGTIAIRDSYFKGNGNCIAYCAHGIYINQIDQLIVERCEFVEQHIGHHVKSRARRTELRDNLIHDGPDGNSSYLVDIPDGGDLVMSGNTLEKGPGTDNDKTAVSLGAESLKNPTSEIRIEGNTFANRMTVPTDFVRNWTHTPAVLRGNTLYGRVTALDGPGTVEMMMAQLP
jgi:hypothetical protein